MFICDDKKFIFLHVPKTAGTSIHVYLKDYYNLENEQRVDPLPDLHHKKAQDILKENADYKNYFKFCVVRNPFARLFSGYKDFRFEREVFDIDFERFVLNEFIKNFSNDIHFIPQHNFTHVNDKLFVDKIIKYENLEEVSKCFEKIGIKFEGLELHRGSEHPNEPYQTHYNDSMIRIVKDFYKKDLELFNYTF